jgi:hypothetical protein
MQVPTIEIHGSRVVDPDPGAIKGIKNCTFLYIFFNFITKRYVVDPDQH